MCVSYCEIIYTFGFIQQYVPMQLVGDAFRIVWVDDHRATRCAQSLRAASKLGIKQHAFLARLLAGNVPIIKSIILIVLK